MRRIFVPLTAALALCASSGVVLAQTASQSGAAAGANAGASVLGPVGAVVGGVTGAAVGGAADIAGAVTRPLAPPPSTVTHTTCVTDAAGNRSCDTVQHTDD